ncbi:MAG: putative transposase [Kiritimatiellia bacterium]
MIESIVCRKGLDSPQAQTVLQTLFASEADIHPDPAHGQLIVRVHCAASPVVDRHREKLFAILNETQTCYPGTALQMVYELVGANSENQANGATPISGR